MEAGEMKPPELNAMGLSKERVIRVVQDLVPLWDGKEITLTPLSGGMSNIMYTADCGSQRVVVRLLSPHLDDVIDRSTEMRIVTYLGSTGLGPRCLGASAIRPSRTSSSFSASPVSLIPASGFGGGSSPSSPKSGRPIIIRIEEYIVGRTLCVDDLRHNSRTIAAMACKVAALHAQRPDLRRKRKRGETGDAGVAVTGDGASSGGSSQLSRGGSADSTSDIIALAASPPGALGEDAPPLGASLRKSLHNYASLSLSRMAMAAAASGSTNSSVAAAVPVALAPPLTTVERATWEEACRKALKTHDFSAAVTTTTTTASAAAAASCEGANSSLAGGASPTVAADSEDLCLKLLVAIVPALIAQEINLLCDLLDTHGGPIVLVHGDLQGGNWILKEAPSSGEGGEGGASFSAGSDSDGDDLTLIDYEYAGFNARALDLGNLFCEHTFNYVVSEHPGYSVDFSVYPSVAWQKNFLSLYLAETERLAHGKGGSSTTTASEDEGGPSAKAVAAVSCAAAGSSTSTTSCDPRVIDAQFSDRDVAALALEARLGILGSHLLWSLWACSMSAAKRNLRRAVDATVGSQPSQHAAAEDSGHSSFAYAHYGIARILEYFHLKHNLEHDRPDWFEAASQKDSF